MLFVAFIQVASFGADQFSFGATLPPNSLIVSLMVLWISRKSSAGSGSSSSDAKESLEKTPLSESSMVVLFGRGSSGGMIMPSARRYSRKDWLKGISRALGVIALYLSNNLAM